jgi:DNA adenine methylase
LFNAPYGKYAKPNICDTANLLAVATMLQGACPIHADFREVEELVEAGDFVYFDSPYAPLTATSNFTAYTAGGFGLQAQIDLRDMALRMKKAGVHVLLSNSSAPLIEELYGPDFTLEPNQARRSINSSGDKRGAIKEYLIR